MAFQGSLNVANILGEGPVWDAREQRLLWTDVEAAKLYIHQYGADTHIIDLPDRLGSFALTADADQFIGAFAGGFARYHMGSGGLSWIERIESDIPYTRMNDGRVDTEGRFWAGSMIEGDLRQADGGAAAALYRYDRGQVSRIFGDILISNGLCFSPDGGTAYFADSPRRTIYAIALGADGQVGERRVFAQTPAGAYPDGAVIDAEGYLWSAHWGAGRVVRYSPEGNVDRVLDVPVTQPTCPAFGGPDGKTLYVTSARTGLSDSVLAAEPEAGNVLIYRMDVAGPPAVQVR